MDKGARTNEPVNRLRVSGNMADFKEQPLREWGVKATATEARPSFDPGFFAANVEYCGRNERPQTRRRLQTALAQGMECTLETLRDEVNNAPASDRWKAMAAVVRDLGSPELFPLLIQSVLSNPTDLERTVQRSYVHRNGFDKFILGTCGSFKLRCHVFWPEQRKIFAEDVHDHRWVFASHIVQGRMQQHVLEEDPEGAEVAHKYGYTAIEQGNSFRAESYGPTNLRRTADVRLSAGQTYFCPLGLLHRIIDETGSHDNFGVTLILTAPPELPPRAAIMCTKRTLDTGDQMVSVERMARESVTSSLQRLLASLPPTFRVTRARL